MLTVSLAKAKLELASFQINRNSIERFLRIYSMQAWAHSPGKSPLLQNTKIETSVLTGPQTGT